MEKKNSSLFLLLFGGSIAAFGPFITDFYLPALPALGVSFATSASMVQLTITLGLIGLALGQLFAGPLSDRFGRRPLLIASMVLFSFATVGCLATTSITAFLVCRFMQGIAGAGGVVISRSIATDLYSGQPLARFYSMLSGVTGIAPIAAPVLGGVMLSFTDWRGIFVALLAIGVCLLCCSMRFRESLPREKRLVSNNVVANYRKVLSNGTFMSYVAVQALVMGTMFAYIASSPFIFQEHYSLSPLAYSLCFGANGLGIMVGSLCASRFGSMQRALRTGVSAFVVVSLIASSMLITDANVWLTESALLCTLFCIGIILPSSTTLAMEPVAQYSGNASAILGFATFFVGGLCSPLAGLGNMMISTSVIMIVTALLAAAITLYTLLVGRTAKLATTDR